MSKLGSDDQDVEARDIEASSVSTEDLLTTARDAHTIVYEVSGEFRAAESDGVVATGSDLVTVLEAAISNLTSARSSTETVAVFAGGDWTQQLTVTDSHTRLVFTQQVSGDLDNNALRVQDAENVTISEFDFDGGSQTAGSVILGRGACDGLEVQNPRIIGSATNGISIAEDGGNRPDNIEIRNPRIENVGNHAIDLSNVTNTSVSNIRAFNNERTAINIGGGSEHIGVDRIVSEGNEAALRISNGSTDVTADNINSDEDERGIHLPNAVDFQISNVSVERATVEQGILVSSGCEDGQIIGGNVHETQSSVAQIRLNDCTGVGVIGIRVRDTTDSASHGIQETGDNVDFNRIVGCDLRGGGTTANLETVGANTVTSANIT